MDRCPKCQTRLSWIAGEPAHPDNQYCDNCGWPHERVGAEVEKAVISALSDTIQVSLAEYEALITSRVAAAVEAFRRSAVEVCTSHAWRKEYRAACNDIAAAIKSLPGSTTELEKMCLRVANESSKQAQIAARKWFDGEEFDLNLPAIVRDVIEGEKK